MMQTPALVKNAKRTQLARTKSLPAPVGGWNDRDSLAEMDPKDAVILDDFFPLPSKVITRKGSITWKTGFSGTVESLMAYQPQTGTSSLFAASGTAFYNATATGAIGAAVVSGLTNARWQHTNIATSGGNFLLAVNGSDKLRGWNGSAWWADGDGTHDITGVDTATCINITTFKRRVWLTQKNTANAWYLPIDSIAGVAQKLDFGPLFIHGGFLMAICNWTIDSGVGSDDFSVFIGSNGDVAVYRGTDPASATTWALVGVFWMGSPVGRRCVVQYAGDAALICQDGLVPLSKALVAERQSTAVAFTDKIQNIVSMAISAYASNYGWQVIPFAGENMLIVNVPISSTLKHQYVMNTITGAWCRFKGGWPATCFEMFGDELFFGGPNAVYKAWQGQSDSGMNINCEALQAFNYFGLPDSLKEFTLARPIVALNQSSAFLCGLNVDFETTTPVGAPTFTPSTAATWGAGLWGTGKWGGSPKLQKGWQTVAGLGYCAALHILAVTGTGQIEWAATDYAYKVGGVL